MNVRKHEPVSDALLRAQVHVIVDECLTPAVLEVCRDHDNFSWLMRMVRQEFEYAVKYANPSAGPTVLEREENGYYQLGVSKKEE